MLKEIGKNPTGTRQARVRQSPNYREGSFQNVEPTEVILKGTSYGKMLSDFFNKPKDTVPAQPLPSVKTDLRQLSDEKPVLVWFGHSSYLITHRGFRILVDPVLSGYASPVRLFGKAFPGSNVYAPADFGPLDLVLITHDHYDHLDYPTIRQLLPQTKRFCTALGVGAHLEHWGIPAGKIVELDWGEAYAAAANVELRATPARHFSGRFVKRGQTLWNSFILQLSDHRIFIGGDSGYDGTFQRIGEQHGPFDLALLEAGQYGYNWPSIHMLPEQTVQAALDLRASTLLPVHWAKFALAYHPWHEPIERVLQAAVGKISVIAPQIGESIELGAAPPPLAWWRF